MKKSQKTLRAEFDAVLLALESAKIQETKTRYEMEEIMGSRADYEKSLLRRVKLQNLLGEIGGLLK